MHYKDTNNVVHYLSDEDISNGGEALLPSGSVEITDEEAATLAAILPPSTTPNITAFIQDIKAAIGGIVNSNNLAKEYPIFFSTIELGEFVDAAALIEDAVTKGLLDPEALIKIKTSATNNNIPITLP